MAIIFGLAAALVWAIGNLGASRASRLMTPNSLLAGIALVGGALCLPLLLTEGPPRDASFTGLFWLTLGGVGNIAGLALIYIAYRAADVSLVAPISSTEGAIAAVIAIAAGQRVKITVIVLLAVIVLGVVRAAGGDSPKIAVAGGRFNWGVAAVACLGAVCFGVSLYAIGRASGRDQFGWIAASPRLVGILCVALPMLVRGQIKVTRAGAPGMLLAAACEVGGFSLYSLAAHRSVAVAAVLGSLFAAFAVVGATILFGERLTRGQCFGVATIVVGVAALSAVTA